MDCNDCLERLYSFLDTELEGTELEAVKTHLADCGSCGDNLVFEQRFLDQIRDSCTSDMAPSELRERVILRVRSERKTSG